MSCDRVCRWDVRVLRFGLCANGYLWPRGLGLARLLRWVPVGWVRDGAGLGHRADGLLREADVVGIVEEGWEDQDAVYATVHLVTEAVALRRGLQAMERDGVLSQMGVSVVARMVTTPALSSGRWVERVTEVRDVHSLDFVTKPAGEDAHVLRSLAPAEVSTTARRPT